MEGGPAANFYTIPPTIGFVGHTPTKCRLPSVTIGRKINDDPVYGHGMLYDLRDQTRFGKLYRPNFNFGGWRPARKEWTPAPNIYNPIMDLVRPKAPRVSIKNRTLPGRDNRGYPAPNVYALPSTIRKQKPTVGATSPRFREISEGTPAPNTYSLPPTDAYKYSRVPNVALPSGQPLKRDYTPAPNMYRVTKTKVGGKSFGQRTKQVVYLTVEDLAHEQF